MTTSATTPLTTPSTPLTPTFDPVPVLARELSLPERGVAAVVKLLAEGAGNRGKLAEAAAVYLRRPSGHRVLRDQTRAPAPAVTSLPTARWAELRNLNEQKDRDEKAQAKAEIASRHAKRLEEGGSSSGGGRAPDEIAPRGVYL